MLCKKTLTIEEVIEENLFSEEDGRNIIDFANNPENYPMLSPMICAYYDKKNKGYLILDEYNLLDDQDNMDKILDEFAFNHPERFVPQRILADEALLEAFESWLNLNSKKKSEKH